jgi:dissimilatory sulfite reductase (desulfoviridin) alpha/beta subunit
MHTGWHSGVMERTSRQQHTIRKKTKGGFWMETLVTFPEIVARYEAGENTFDLTLEKMESKDRKKWEEFVKNI